MWATMEHHEPSVFTDSNEDGIARVKLGGYAFFMESASIEYTTQKECDLTKVGDLLDSKAYGIGMPMSELVWHWWYLLLSKSLFPDSPFRDNINEAILKLKERRIVQELRERWWITNNYKVVNGKPEFCEKESDENKDTLDIDHVRGVFLILMIGIGLASLVGILEFMWNVRKVSISQKVSQWQTAGQKSTANGFNCNWCFHLDHTVRGVSQWIGVCMQSLDQPQTSRRSTRLRVAVIW